MQFWTNGLLKSTVHRVVFPEGESEDRYSEWPVPNYVFYNSQAFSPKIRRRCNLKQGLYPH